MQTKFLSCMLYNVSTRHAQVSFILHVVDTLTQVFTLLYVLFWKLKKRDIHICVLYTRTVYSREERKCRFMNMGLATLGYS